MNHPDEQPTPTGLAGLVIGVPAARRGAETARLIERWGAEAIIGAAVQEIPVADPGPVIEATRRVVEGPASWSVHLTGVGTRRWFEIAESAGLGQDLVATLNRARVVARGAKATAALRSRQLAPDWVPEGETSAEIARWMQDRVADDDLVALQRHGEPVPGLSGPLAAAGASVIEIATYHWDLPDDLGPATHLIRSLVEGRVHALAITSAPQLRNLFRIADGLDCADELQQTLQSRVFTASVGNVASEAFQERGLEPDLVASPSRLGALMRQLASSHERILAKTGARVTGGDA